MEVGWHRREKFLLHNLNSSFVTETLKNVMYDVHLKCAYRHSMENCSFLHILFMIIDTKNYDYNSNSAYHLSV